MNQQEESQKQPTPEEIKAYEDNLVIQKKELTAFYEKELPLLRLHSEYEECITRIETAKFTRLEIMLAKNSMMAKNPNDGNPNDGKPSGKKPTKAK